MAEAVVEIPEALEPVFEAPRGEVRYRGAYGGRGSGKSFTFAKMAAIFGYAEPLRILCTREYQNSIKDSMHAELAAAIASEPWLEDHYEIGESYIRGANGTEFIFKGLRLNISSIKSMARIDICIIEEAEDVPERSWRDLIPTIRAPKSEIWPIWNPQRRGSPVDERMRRKPHPRAMVVELNYEDNPWFPAELEEERRHDQETLDPEMYAHIWEGAYLENSKAQVLHGKVAVREFEPQPGWDGPYHGVDYGFSADPTAGVRCWVGEGRLWVEYEAGRPKLDLDDTADFLKERIPGIERHVIRADSARPESTSYLKRHGLPRIESVKKWTGSVEDGIQHMRSYQEIVFHPRCRESIKEARLYSHKIDRLTGDILPDIVDDFNHYMDAIRYALAPLIRVKNTVGVYVRRRK